ncbi:MAG TPA: LysR family transcriptional regulator [Pararobbsia sp.]|nr:LysR family transcriptional regulator [Pararobbsia sp.]
MELRHLRYFVAVADEQNFTRAAERLNISQPPLSRQIQQIEDELGTPLFERGARPLRLTEAGRFFYTHALRLLEQAGELATMTRRVAQLERRLVIGFVPSTLYGPLPRVIRRFRAACPNVELTLLEMYTLEQLEALSGGRIDVGFGRVRFEDANVRREVLSDEPLVAAVPADHALAAANTALSLKQIAAQTLIAYPRTPRPSYADQVLSALRDHGLEPKAVHEVQELQTALGLVAAGIGVSLVPESVQRLRRDDVVYRSLTDGHVVSPIIMSTRMHDTSPESTMLTAFARETFESDAARDSAP